MTYGYMYILECADGSYYTGSTKYLDKRLVQHQAGEGANHTKKHLPVKLVYFEEFDRIDTAFNREKQVQGWSRKKKEALIHKMPDKLHDLAKCMNETSHKNIDGFNSAAFDSAQSTGNATDAERSRSGSDNNNIPNGWVETTLGKVCELLDCLHKTPKYSKIGLPMVRVTDVKNGILNTKKCFNVDDDIFKAFSKSYEPKIGDIVFTRVGSFGLSAIVKKEEKFCIGQNTTLIISTDIDPFFLFYYLISKAARHQIEGLSSGSTQPTISMASIRKIVVPLPQLKEQKAIAKILTSFDDKIENLQAQNKTLETTAQTIFKEWFGKYQIGDELPEGWRFMELDDVSLLAAGGDRPKIFSEEKNEYCNVPIYSNGINKNGLYGYTNTPKIKEESVTISARGTIGFVCLRFEPYVPIVRLVVAIPKQEYISSKYLYLYLKNMKITGTGTTQQQLTVPAFKKESILIPTVQKMDEFTSFCNSIFHKIQINNSQIQTLKKTRDTLLPKLMSGALRVSKCGSLRVTDFKS